jgi:hypothetical protein
VLEKLVTKIRVASFGQFWYPPAVHAPQTLGFVLDWNVHNIDEDHPIGLNRDPSLKTFAGVWAIVVILPKMQQLLIQPESFKSCSSLHTNPLLGTQPGVVSIAAPSMHRLVVHLELGKGPSSKAPAPISTV